MRLWGREFMVSLVIIQDVSMYSRKKQLVKYFSSIYTFYTLMIKNNKDKNRIKQYIERDQMALVSLEEYWTFCLF